MNNRFVVWDKSIRRFIDEEEIAISNLGDIYNIQRNHSLSCGHEAEPDDENSYKIFKDTELKDIEGKLIYADCSIVLIDIGDDTEHHGYFSYNKKYARYEFFYIGNPELGGSEYFYLANHRIEIVDTIQENKLGLIEN